MGSAIVIWIRVLLESVIAGAESHSGLVKMIPERYESAGFCDMKELVPNSCPQLEPLLEDIQTDIRQHLSSFVQEMKQHRGKPGLDLVLTSVVEKVVGMMTGNSK